MFAQKWDRSCFTWRCSRKTLLSAVAFAMAAALALPSRAADDRAVKSRVAPVYPEIARRLKITGEVKVEALVDSDGQVKSVKTVSGNHVLAVAAEDAVRQWKFQPGSGDSVVVVAVNFTINQ